MRTVRPSRAFERDLKALSGKDAHAIRAALKAFLSGTPSAGLKSEKVRARAGYFTIRATRGVRILLREDARGEFTAAAVGNHDYVYRSYFKG